MGMRGGLVLLVLAGAARADVSTAAPEEELRTRTPPAPPERKREPEVVVESRLQPPTRFLPLSVKREREVSEIDPLRFVDATLSAGDVCGGRTVVKRVVPELRKRRAP
jgi:hypothetical protein